MIKLKKTYRVKLKKTYRVFVGQAIPCSAPGYAANIYGTGHMAWVAYSTLRGTVWMGQGADRSEALADLSLRMFGHDEMTDKFKVIEG